SESLLADSTEAARQSRELEEQILNFERSVRLFLVLNNTEGSDNVTQDINAIRALREQLSATVNDPEVGKLTTLIAQRARRIELAAREAAGTAQTESETFTTQLAAQFTALDDNADSVRQIVRDYIARESRELREDAERAQRTLTWQSIAIVPVTIGVVLIFTLLLGRPIRRLDRAIAQLGQGGFSKEIHVPGPTDLQALGRQLEWLRVRLLELAQEKNRFLRHMSHELKTPLANIREGTDLLLDGTVGELDDPQQEVTAILRSNGLKLQRLIENLLSFSSWQARSETLTLRDFGLIQLVRSVVSDHRLQLKAQKIKLHVDIENIEVTADKEKLRTALDNLLSNAVKFTPERGDIYIKARAAQRSFILEVADTGPGIPDDEQKKIFDPFFQGRTPQSGPVDGTGIGLSVVTECAQAHGGTVELVRGEYRGAHFRMHIPQERVDIQRRLVANG
ncbi:MAG: HAMP domain-containing sensor histidine kinase, partial [Pseudomonadota bacterium]